MSHTYGLVAGTIGVFDAWGFFPASRVPGGTGVLRRNGSQIASLGAAGSLKAQLPELEALSKSCRLSAKASAWHSDPRRRPREGPLIPLPRVHGDAGAVVVVEGVVVSRNLGPVPLDKEAERPGVADRAEPSTVASAVRLGDVFQDEDPLPTGNVDDFVHLRRPAPHMHGDGAAGELRDLVAEILGVEGESPEG